MTRIANRACHALCLRTIRAAGLLVPACSREEWRNEWASELWHVSRECLPQDRFSWKAQGEVGLFCMGCVPDALCLRREFWASAPAPVAVHGSAGQCLLRLATLLGLCAILARLLPGVRAEQDASGQHLRPGLILIQDARFDDASAPTIRAAQFRDWQSQSQRFFKGLAFYCVAREPVLLSPALAASWNVAHASANLFALMGVQIESLPVPSANTPSVILSYPAWLRAFGKRSFQAAPLAVRIGRRTLRIAGILPDGPWRLPGEPDAWILEPASALAAGPRSAPGYLIAQLSPRGEAEMFGDRIPIVVHGPNDTEIDFSGVSFTEHAEGPGNIFRFALLLALLALPAVASVSLSESNFSSHRPGWRHRMIRWCFLAAKIGLVIAISYFLALDAAYGIHPLWSSAGELFQLVTSFGLCLFGLRWALLDQRERCPVCLRRVTHPAQVGLASRTFLGWNGTEMICTGGHTLLHVPSLPTSWFGNPRWLYLDDSWEFLFADSSSW